MDLLISGSVSGSLIITGNRCELYLLGYYVFTWAVHKTVSCLVAQMLSRLIGDIFVFYGGCVLISAHLTCVFTGDYSLRHQSVIMDGSIISHHITRCLLSITLLSTGKFN